MALWPSLELRCQMACMKQAAELRLYNTMLINHQEANLWPVFALLAAASAPLVPPSMVQGGRGGWLHLTAGEPGFLGNTFSCEMLSQGMEKKTLSKARAGNETVQMSPHLSSPRPPQLPALSCAQQGSSGNRWFPTEAEPPAPLRGQTWSDPDHLFCSCGVSVLGACWVAERFCRAVAAPCCAVLNPGWGFPCGGGRGRLNLPIFFYLGESYWKIPIFCWPLPPPHRPWKNLCHFPCWLSRGWCLWSGCLAPGLSCLGTWMLLAQSQLNRDSIKYYSVLCGGDTLH